MKVGIPVQCQNGHRATYWFELIRLTWHDRGVVESERCDCPKHGLEQGWSRSEGPVKIEQKL